MSVGLVVSFPVSPENSSQLEKVLLELQAAVHKEEPAALVYQLCKEEKSGTLYMLELYKDASALEQHNQTPHFKKASKAFGKLLSGAPKVQLLNGKSPSGLKNVRAEATIGIVASMRVKPGSEQKFEKVMAGLAAQVHKNEDGCLFYQLLQDQKDPTSYAMMEFYKDAKAIAVHNKTPYFKSEVRKTGPFMDGKMGLTFLKTNYAAASKL